MRKEYYMKKVITVLFLILWVISCKDDPSGTGTIPPVADDSPPVVSNSPPVASWYGCDYLVSGAGDTSSNGEYTDSGLYNFYSSYTNGSCYIHWDGSDYWGIDTTQNDDGYSAKLYYHVNVADVVPETDNDDPWTVGDGATPVPSVIAVSPVSGDTGAGNIMRGNYRYSDVDGDPEGVSTYKWYRCTGLSDSGTEILGETEQTYTTIPGTDSFIRFEVTPVDDIGNAGVPLRSDAVPIS
jgi:hypothetical protein